MTAATIRKPAFQASPTNPNIQEIQTEPERRPDMPEAEAVTYGR
jgi:2-aminomuconate deaminase